MQHYTIDTFEHHLKKIWKAAVVGPGRRLSPGWEVGVRFPSQAGKGNAPQSAQDGGGAGNIAAQNSGLQLVGSDRRIKSFEAVPHVTLSLRLRFFARLPQYW